MNLQRIFLTLEGEMIDNRYALKQLLGVGGFGGVFHSEEVFLDQVLRDVAVKLIAPLDIENFAQLSPAERQTAYQKQQRQQRDELITAVNLSHPNIIPGFHVGLWQREREEYLYLVMELATGTLQDELKERQRSEAEIVEILLHVAQGLAYLHGEKQLVHRDLKPGNILRCGERWKLSDFGLVRQMNDKTQTRTGNIAGSIAFMPPEAFFNDTSVISTAWDMWSLGILGAILLANGRLPYDYRSEMELMLKVYQGDVTFPATMPERLAPVIRNCLVNDRKARWTATQVIACLQPQPQIFPAPSVPPPGVPKSSAPFVLPPVPESSAPSVPSPVPESSAPPVLSPVQSSALKTFSETLGGGIKLELVGLPGGEFNMGSPNSDDMAFDNEKPQHLVRVASFYIGKYPITQGQYEAVMGSNPSGFGGKPNNPVEQVSWNKAQEFCEKLSKQTGKNYRLPSEAEWEYACRAGTTTRYHYGDDPEELGKYAWFSGNSENQTHAVGDKDPNPWGLYDMPGNVWEWCEDAWHESYEGAPTDGSAWVQGNEHTKVLRGGSWTNCASYCRSSYRGWFSPDVGGNNGGFRVVMSP